MRICIAQNKCPQNKMQILRSLRVIRKNFESYFMKTFQNSDESCLMSRVRLLVQNFAIFYDHIESYIEICAEGLCYGLYLSVGWVVCLSARKNNTQRFKFKTSFLENFGNGRFGTKKNYQLHFRVI